MGQWRPVSNLRDQTSRRPPVVVFFLCLLSLSVTFVCVGLYSQNHDIKDPDISVDWNGVLGTITALQFCTHLNDSDSQLEEDNSPLMINHNDQSNISTSASQVSLLVPLRFAGDVPGSKISTTLLGSQLGLKGAAAKTSINISLFLQTDAAKKQTEPLLTCIQFSALSHILPQTPPPPECPVVGNEVQAPSVQVVASNKQKDPRCFSLEYTADPRLTVMLSEEEKALCRLHLLLASAALLALCVLLSLCAACSSRSPYTYQPNDLPKESLLNQ